MSAPLQKIFDRFHAAILENDALPAIGDIRANDRLSPQKRMSIYIDGYRLRLMAALRADYPALCDYLGETQFHKLAALYIELHPSAHFNLDRYAFGFADFIAGKSSDEFAHDLANLEQTIGEVFMGDESEPMKPDSFSGLSAEHFGSMHLQPRHASRLLNFNFPVYDWLISQRQENHPPPPMRGLHFLYIYRHHNEVQFMQLTEAAYRLLQLLFSGIKIGEALEKIAQQHPQLMEAISVHIQPWFAEWLAEGFFSQKSAKAN